MAPLHAQTRPKSWACHCQRSSAASGRPRVKPTAASFKAGPAGDRPSSRPSLSNAIPSRSPPPQNALQDGLRRPAPSLSDLSRLLQLEKYQSRRCRQAQHHLHQVHIVAARTARLIHIARSVQRTLAECIKSEDKHSFVNLFSAFHDALSDCSGAASSFSEDRWKERENCIESPASFVDDLPADSRNVVLEFLSRIRHDGNFIADRLATRTHRELVSLLPEKGQARSNDSVLGFSPRTSSRSSKHLGFVADSQTELLASLEYGCPLDTLINSVRGVSSLRLQDDPIATNVWATVCAKLISEQKPGSEKLVPAVIDAWASSSPWPGKERLGLWISQTLQKGSFLLEQPSKQSFRLRVQGRQEPSAEDDILQELFYTGAVNSLLCLFKDPLGASLIPEGARKLCHAICRKLQHHSNHLQAFPNFVLIRWLFSSFIPDAVTLPEASNIRISGHATN